MGDDATGPTKTEIARLRERAAGFRRLAKEHGEAGNASIAEKLLAVADELEAKADRLEGPPVPHPPGAP